MDIAEIKITFNEITKRYDVWDNLEGKSTEFCTMEEVISFFQQEASRWQSEISEFCDFNLP